MIKKYIIQKPFNEDISVSQLAALYRVPIGECVVVNSEGSLAGYSEEFKRKAVKLGFSIRGNYSVNNRKRMSDYKIGDTVTLNQCHKLSRLVRGCRFKILAIDNSGNCDTSLDVHGEKVVINYFYLDHVM